MRRAVNSPVYKALDGDDPALGSSLARVREFESKGVSSRSVSRESSEELGAVPFWSCSCHFADYMGLPCRHMFAAVLRLESGDETVDAWEELWSTVSCRWKNFSVQGNQAYLPVQYARRRLTSVSSRTSNRESTHGVAAISDRQIAKFYKVGESWQRYSEVKSASKELCAISQNLVFEDPSLWIKVSTVCTVGTTCV